MLLTMHMREQIEAFAKSLGFDLVGFSPAKIEKKYLDAFQQWIQAGQHGGMQYMEKIERRSDLTRILPGAKSVICLALNYNYPQAPLKSDSIRVARYAYGRDYHKTIGKKLKQLVKFLDEIAPKHQHRSYVDTGPLMERALAEQSGLGRIGKNGCLITEEYGSWVFLAEVITTLDLTKKASLKTSFPSNSGHFSPLSSRSPNPQKIPGQTPQASLPLRSTFPPAQSAIASRWKPSSKNQSFNVCGNCTKCVDACPTGAIIRPGVIDSRLCISYLTIEHKDKIPPHLKKIIDKTKRLYGCDICQEVCPHNAAREKTHTHSELNDPKIATDQLDTKDLKKIHTRSDYLARFAGSALMRSKQLPALTSIKDVLTNLQ